MENFIKQQLFALDMEVLTSQMRRLQLQDRVVTLLNELWDNVMKASLGKQLNQHGKKMEWNLPLEN